MVTNMATHHLPRNTRRVHWIKAARKDFAAFPPGARDNMLDALTAVAEGGHPSIAKPLNNLGAGVMELALPHKGDAFRLVYALRINADIWIVHAFQKKSKSGIATPQPDIDLVRDRIKRLKEILS